MSEMGDKINVLDHGYVQLIEAWGSDKLIIEAARMSTDKGFLGWEPEVHYICPECEYTFVDNQPVDRAIDCLANPSHGRMPYKLVHRGDEKLLCYLYTHKHMTPFEMAGLTIEVQAPIFVFREWHRHRVPFGYNEMSARYTPLPDVNYTPTIERCMITGGTNKQAQGVDASIGLTPTVVDVWLNELYDLYQHAQAVYQRGLNLGIPKEVARLPVPVGRYSRMRATGNLRGWLAFLTLRMDENAQFEIQQYANIVSEIIALHFPRTHALFMKK